MFQQNFGNQDGGEGGSNWNVSGRNKYYHIMSLSIIFNDDKYDYVDFLFSFI